MMARSIVMPEVIDSFSSIMTWLVLLLCLLIIVLLGLSTWHLPSHWGRPLLGVMLMGLVLAATGFSWFLPSQKTQSWSRLLLPLAASLILLSLYRLSFPPQVPGSHRQTRQQVLLLLLTMSGLLAAGGLVLLDLLFP
jgi:hypothetical protein